MNAGSTTIDGSPPSCGGYTPDWGSPYGPGKTICYGVAIYCVASYSAVLVSQMVEIAIAPLLLARFDAARSSSDLSAILEEGLPTAVSACVLGSVGAILVGLVVFQSDAPSRAYFGLGKPRLLQWSLFLFTTVSLFTVMQVFLSFVVGPERVDVWTKVYRNTRPLLPLWIGLGLLGPLFEELFYRGFLYSGFRRTALGATGTVVVTAALFATAHYQYGLIGVLWIFLLGLVLGIARRRSDNVKLPLLMHITYNVLFLIYCAATN